MSDEEKPNSMEDSWKASLQKKKESEERVEKMREDTKKRLETDEAILEYFSQFNKDSVEFFINSYAHLKASYIEYGDSFGKEAERRNLEYYEEAENCLKLIQLKKLFDLRCQWGANKIKLEGIDISWDFIAWTEDIFNCPILPPVTKEEYDLFYTFTLTNDFSHDLEYDWLDVFDMRSWQEEEESRFPEWFHFHNTYTGASSYFGLPDKRKDKEQFYRHSWFEKKNTETEKKYESGELKRYIADERPWLTSHHFDEVEKFVKLFEEDKIKTKFYDFENSMHRLSRNPDSDDGYLNETAMELAMDLANKNIIIPLEANQDWRIALINALAKYKSDIVRATLPLVFEDYLFRIENNIRLQGIDDIYKDDNANRVKEQVLDGRELNGEPRDFNY